MLKPLSQFEHTEVLSQLEIENQRQLSAIGQFTAVKELLPSHTKMHLH